MIVINTMNDIRKVRKENKLPKSLIDVFKEAGSKRYS